MHLRLLSTPRRPHPAQLDSGVAGMWKLVMREGTPVVHAQEIIT